MINLPNQIYEIVNKRAYFEKRDGLLNFFMDSYVGGIAYRESDYLVPLPNKELDLTANFRRSVSAYDNHCKRIVNSIITKLYSTTPTRLNIETELSVISFRDINGREVKIDQFFRSLFTYQLVLGEVFIMIEPPINSSGGDTLAPVNELSMSGAKYNVYMILPQNIPCLEYDTDGGVRSAVIVASDSLIIWGPEDRQVWKLEKGQYSRIVSIPNSIGFAPIFRVATDVNKDGYGESLLNDIADLNKLIYNIDAVELADLFVNGQHQLTVPMDEELAILYKDWGYVDEETLRLDLSGKPFVPVSSTGKGLEWLTKNLDYHERLQVKRANFVDAIDRLSNQNLNKMVAQSGVSKAYDSSNENMNLESLSYLFEGTEYLFFDIFGKVSTILNDNIVINYSHSFDIIDKGQEFDELLEFRERVPNPYIHVEIDKILIDMKLKGKVSDDIYDRLIKSADVVPTSETTMITYNPKAQMASKGDILEDIED